MEGNKRDIIIESNVLDGFLIISNDRIIDCNSRIQEILGGVPEEEVVGRKFYELARDIQPNGKKSYDVYKEMVDRVQLIGKCRFEFQMQNVKRDLISTEVAFIERHTEEIEVIHAIVRDITTYSDSKNDRGEEIEIYNSIFNNSHTPMLVIDSENGKIMDGNLAACNYYGYTMHELLQLNISDINTLSKQEIFGQFNSMRNNGRTYFNFKHRLASGEIRDVEVYSGPIKVKGKSLVLSIIHDVQYKREMEQKFEIQEGYFKGLYENSPEAVAILDNDFCIININKSFEDIFQYKLKEIKGLNITKAICDEKFYDESTYFKDSIARGAFVRQETQRRRKDGKLVYVSFLSFPIIINGKQIGVYAIYSDLSHLKENESKTRLFAEIFKNNTVGVVVTDIEGNIQWINDAFTEITGYSAEEAVGQKPSLLKSGKHGTDYYCNMWNAIISAGKWQGEIFNKRKNGEIYQEWLNIIAIRDDRGKIERFVGMLSDITDAKRKENRIEVLTNRDSLTSLFNRDYFVNKLNYEMLRRNKEPDPKPELAVMFLDIDDFKEINDTLGHLVGDEILKEFAFRLKSSVREYDIATRFGGDEFIVLFPTTRSDNEILHMANRIIEETSRPFYIDNTELHITASIGISRYPIDGIDSTTLIRNADIAMYRSKETKSRKITLFESALDEKLKEYFKVKNSLRSAISNKEFYLLYQPIIDTSDDHIIGVEALLRWNLNGEEPVSPLKFIPVAEKNGYMQAIGEWVLIAACKQSKIWQDKGYRPVLMSVNVSVMQLEQPNFYEVVERALKESDLRPEHLQLEITETVFMKAYDEVLKTIKRINALGIKIAIDDFGTGYSSLGKLSRLEIAKLKIDRSFISEINESENNKKIVKAIISLAESLNLELVAEGVETEEQLEFLVNNNCSIVQGYLYSRPIDAITVEKQLKKILNF